MYFISINQARCAQKLWPDWLNVEIKKNLMKEQPVKNINNNQMYQQLTRTAFHKLSLGTSWDFGHFLFVFKFIVLYLFLGKNVISIVLFLMPVIEY